MVNDLGDCELEGTRASVVQLAAGVRRRPGRDCRANHRCEGGAQRVSRYAGEIEGPEFLAWVLFLCATSWAMVKRMMS